MKKLSSLISIGVVLVLWHFLAVHNIIDGQFFPSPWLIFRRLISLFSEETFLFDLKSSSWRLAISFFISVILSVMAALLCSHSKIIDKIFNPLIAVTFPLPKVAIMPLLLLVFGLGDLSKIIMISLGMFFILFVHLRVGMLNLREQQVGEIIKIYQIKNWDYLYHVLLKGVFLEFLVGLKMAMGYGLTLVVVSEISMSRNGIGHFIWQAWDAFNVIDMYAGIFLLSFVGLFIYLTLDFFVKRNFYKYA